MMNARSTAAVFGLAIAWLVAAGASAQEEILDRPVCCERAGASPVDLECTIEASPVACLQENDLGALSAGVPILDRVCCALMNAGSLGCVGSCGAGACERPYECTEEGTLACTPGEPPVESDLCGNGLDDDCDGRVDEGFDNLGASCKSGVGVCERSGTFVCTIDGTATECDAVPGTPGAELCGNGLDDDCDGQADEGFASVGEPCRSGVGACEERGTTVCTADRRGTTCDAVPGTPSQEVCGNRIDDDCDGQTDEAAGPEVCNGIDDDCDFLVDEGFDVGAACSVGVGACQRSGQRVCAPHGFSSECNAVPGSPREEICGNNVDDDCDGVTDEGQCSCEAPLQKCAGNVCLDLQENVENCGSCGNSCVGDFPNAGAVCSAGQCRLGACSAGFDDCDGIAANGCEKDVGSDPDNCGGCGNQCAVGESCSAGTCVVSPSNFATLTPAMGLPWAYGGQIGLQAGHEQCQALGADHVCTYAEVETARRNGNFAVFPNGTTLWIHRVNEVVVVNGTSSPPGAGGRCNDWTYRDTALQPSIADGEYAVVSGGDLTYFFDRDTAYTGNPADGHAGSGPFDGGPCDGARRIPCCHVP